MSDEIRVPAGLTTDGLIGKRYLARIIDGLILGTVLGILSIVTVSSGVGMTSRTLVVFCVSLPMLVIYGALLESSEWQATVGKKLMGLRVYDGAGDRLSPYQAVARNLLKEGPFLLFGLLPFGNWVNTGWLVVHIIVLHNSPVYQAIHDRVARTLVAAPEATTQLHLT